LWGRERREMEISHCKWRQQAPSAHSAPVLSFSWQGRSILVELDLQQIFRANLLREHHGWVSGLKVFGLTEQFFSSTLELGSFFLRFEEPRGHAHTLDFCRWWWGRHLLLQELQVHCNLWVTISVFYFILLLLLLLMNEISHLFLPFLFPFLSNFWAHLAERTNLPCSSS